MIRKIKVKNARAEIRIVIPSPNFHTVECKIEEICDKYFNKKIIFKLRSLVE